MVEVPNPTLVFKYILVYGDFTVPGRTVNFVIVRFPDRGVNWHKKLMPAVNRLVQSFVPEPVKVPYRRPKHVIEKRMVDGVEVTSEVVHSWPRERKQKAYWNVEGHDPDIWSTKTTDRYDWDGEKLVKVDNA